MKPSDFNTHFVAPVFFFLAIVLFLLSLLFIWSAYSSHAGFIVVACIIFVLAYNLMIFGWKKRA